MALRISTRATCKDNEQYEIVMIWFVFDLIVFALLVKLAKVRYFISKV